MSSWVESAARSAAVREVGSVLLVLDFLVMTGARMGASLSVSLSLLRPWRADALPAEVVSKKGGGVM